MPWMITDERFLTVPLRVKNNEIQKKYIEEWSTQYTVDEIVDKMLAKGIPAGPIYNVKQITEDEHIAKEREMFVEIDHPVIGKMKVNGNPVKLMDMMPQISCPAPTLGQDNEEILGGMLGYSEEEIEELKEKIAHVCSLCKKKNHLCHFSFSKKNPCYHHTNKEDDGGTDFLYFSK